MKKIRLIFCTDGIFPHAVGGMQRHSALLLEALSKFKNELDITVIHPHSENIFSPSTGIKEVKIEGIDEGRNYLRECFAYSRRVYAEIEKRESDVIYSQGLAVWYGLKNISHKTIVNPHGLEPFQALSLKDKLIAIPFKRVFKRIFNMAGYVVSLGGGLTGILRKHITNPETKVVVLPNATNPAEGKTEPPVSGKTRAVFVGRFAPNKGIHVLMQAIEELNREGKADAFEFTVAGKGPLYEEYQRRFQFPNLSMPGFVDDELLKKLYRENDVFVLPTLFEGMPTVVLEAMAWSLPVIVTDVGATAELVDSSNGWLIRKNDVAELKSALLSFHALSPEQKSLLGNKSLTKVSERFVWEVVAGGHMELFREIRK